MSLKENVEKKLAEVRKSKGPKRNPEIDAIIDRYMKANPDRVAYLKTETKDQLVRRAVLREALKHDASQRLRIKESEAVGKFLKENPDIAQDIENRIARVPDDRKEQSRVRLGRQEATKSALKMS